VAHSESDISATLTGKEISASEVGLRADVFFSAFFSRFVIVEGFRTSNR